MKKLPIYDDVFANVLTLVKTMYAYDDMTAIQYLRYISAGFTGKDHEGHNQEYSEFLLEYVDYCLFHSYCFTNLIDLSDIPRAVVDAMYEENCEFCDRPLGDAAKQELMSFNDLLERKNNYLKAQEALSH